MHSECVVTYTCNRELAYLIISCMDWLSGLAQCLTYCNLSSGESETAFESREIEHTNPMCFEMRDQTLGVLSSLEV